MATTAKWEVVGKTAKKPKTTNESGQQKTKKITSDDMPRIEASPPLKESSTIYDAFIDKESNHYAQKSATEPSKSTPNDASGKKGAQLKKKPQNAAVVKKEKPITLEEAISQINLSELQTVLATDQATFPDSPLVWLKDLASILCVRMNKIPEPDPVFAGKPKDYPMCLLDAKVHKLLASSLKQCSKRTLELFLEHLMQSMVSDLGKGESTYGFRMFMQIVCTEKPEIAIDNLKKYLGMLQNVKNRPLRCLAIMWGIGQAGNKSLAHGLKVWLEVMLPVLNIRALSQYAVEYLEQLFSIHENVKVHKELHEVLSFRNFFPILDLILSPQSHLHTSLQKKLQGLYPKIKEIAFGYEPENHLRNFFPSFLVRCTPDSNKQLKTELLCCLSTCLLVDKQCFSVWRQMYTKHLPQSSLLLQHIVDNWESLGRRLETKLFRETIRAFSITNDELATQGRTGGDGYQHCVDTCKELLTRMASMRFPWRWVFILMFSVLAGLVGYDVYISKGFRKSQTCKLLTDTGILVFLEQVWARIRLYSGKALLWIEENVPYYYGKACAFVAPYLALFWQKIYDLGIYLAAVSKPGRDWLNTKVPEVIEGVQSKVPWLRSSCSYYLGIIWGFILHLSLWLWQHLVYYTHIVTTWLLENVFTGSLSPENIGQTLAACLTVIQSYTSAAVKWCVQLFSQNQTQS